MNGSGVMIRYNSPMDGMYQLVFSGELLKGQHRGVVKRRLRESLKLSEAQVEKLFTGEPVVVKRSVDETTAEKYQEMFKKAGGQLQIVAVEDATDSAQSAPAKEAAPPESDDAPEEATAEDAPEEATEESAPPVTDTDETHVPDSDVANVGAAMADETEEAPAEVPDPDFEVAEVGSDMLVEPAVVVAPEINVDFDVAEVGADIGDRDDRPPPPAPDVSHIKLVD